MLNLDTHVVILFPAGNLTESELRSMEEHELALSDIVLWKVAMLGRADRLRIEWADPVFQEWLRSLTVSPVTLEIAQQSTQLDFSSDPGDEIIAATSVVEKIPLLTHDRRIRKSKMVPLGP
jgi:PIN domain nuclease of toxin-antitoxin system